MKPCTLPDSHQARAVVADLTCSHPESALRERLSLFVPGGPRIGVPAGAADPRSART